FYTYTSGDVTTGGGMKTWGEATWSTPSVSYAGWGDKRGCQIGSGNKPASEWEIHTDKFDGMQITSVTVSACTASNGSATVSASVNGTPLGSTAAIDDSGLSECVFTGALNAGQLSVKFTNNASKAMYIASIRVKANRPTTSTADIKSARPEAVPADGGVAIYAGEQWLPVSIYSADGIRWFAGEVSGSEFFELEPGIYIVRIDNKPFRILVK
ncbi:MAG: hypothetical protein K2G59_05330, partial [Muribaculaceae bacterium]|nr:hypothetical protein [Muribaculaceae bacterium]